MLLEDQLPGALLVRGVAVRVDQRHRDRVDPHLPVLASHLADAVLIEWRVLLTRVQEPAAGLAHQLERDHARRLQPPGDVAEVAGHGLARDLEHLAVAVGYDQAHPRVLRLEDGVCGHGRAVADEPDLARVHSDVLEHLLDARAERA